MDGPGFHVDVDVLDTAAKSMHDIVADQDNSELRRLCGGPEMYGYDAVYAEFSGFCQAWSVGLDALCDRAQWMGDELGNCARTYRDVDQAAAQKLTDDPALQIVDPPNLQGPVT